MLNPFMYFNETQGYSFLEGARFCCTFGIFVFGRDNMNSSFLRPVNARDASNPTSFVRRSLTTSIIFLMVLVSFNSDALANFNGRGDFSPEEDACLTQLSLIWAARKNAGKAMGSLAAQDRYMRKCLSTVSNGVKVVLRKRLIAAFYAKGATQEDRDHVKVGLKILNEFLPKGDGQVAIGDDGGGNALN
jgi:hypothetical protein